MHLLMKLLILLTFVSHACLVVSAQAEEKKCYQEIVVKNSSGPHHFGVKTQYLGKDGEPVTIAPRSLAVDSKNNIYVGDSVNYRVVKFGGAGKFLFEIKLQPPVRVPKPEISHIIQDIGIDEDDNVYVWNYFEDRVEIYDQNGKFKESVTPDDDKQKGVFAKISRGQFSKYVYEFESYIPDKKLPGRILHSITVVDVGSKKRKVISKCKGVEFDFDEEGKIYSFDNNGNVYTFDGHSNVVKINPFK